MGGCGGKGGGIAHCPVAWYVGLATYGLEHGKLQQAAANAKHYNGSRGARSSLRIGRGKRYQQSIVLDAGGGRGSLTAMRI